MRNYLKSDEEYKYCDKCEKPTKYWIDSVCKKCRPEPPTTENLIILTYKRLGSIKSHLTFYTLVLIINIIIILLFLLGIVELGNNYY